MLTAPTTAAFLSLFGATLAGVSPEISLETPVAVYEGSTKDEAAVAFDGVNFFAVWNDDRCVGRCIVGTRVSTAGARIDPAGMVISRGASQFADPRIACHPGLCLVTWTEAAVGVQYALIDTTTLSASAPVSLSFASAVQEADVATFGTGFILAASAGTNVVVNRITRTGANQDGAGLVVHTGNPADVSVAEVAGNALVVWDDASCGNSCADILGKRVSPAGTLVDVAPFVVDNGAGAQSQPRVTSDGTTALVVWQDAAGPAVRGTRLIADQRQDIPSVQLSTGSAEEPAACFDGRDFVIAFGTTAPALRRMNPTTGALDATQTTLTTSDSRNELGIAAAGHIVAIMWAQFPLSGTRLARVDTSPAGAPVVLSGGLLLNQSTVRQVSTSTGWNGTNYWVLWESNSGAPGILGTRVSAGGVVLDEPPVRFSTTAGHNRPRVSCTTSNGVCVAVWQQAPSGSPAMSVRRLFPDGGFGPGGTVSFALGVEVPEVACNKDACLGLFRAGPAPAPIRGQQINTNDIGFIGPSFNVMNGVSSTNGWVAAWEPHFFVAREEGGAVFVTRVLADGGTDGPTGGLQIATAGAVSSVGAVCGGSECSVVMKEGSGLRMRNVQPQLSLIVDPPAGAFTPPSPVAGHLRVSGDVAFALASFEAGRDIWVTPFSRDGGFAPAGAGELFVDIERESEPSLAVNDAGEVLVSYTRDVTAAPYTAARARARLITGNPDYFPCTNGGACPTTGLCADGVCCDTLCGSSNPDDCMACSVAAGAPRNGICSPRVAGTVCRSANAFCDVPELCDGAATSCPANARAPNGDACSIGAQCSGGVCVLPDGGVVPPLDGGFVQVNPGDGGTQLDGGSQADGGAQSDAGAPQDSGTPSDGGDPEPVDAGALERRQLAVGCDCASVPALPLLLVLAALLLTATRTRRG